MTAAQIRLRRDGSRARVDLRGGAVIPRLIARTAFSARVALVAGRALLLGGDRVEIDVHVGAGCRLDLEEVGGTVAYDADGERSSWTVRITVEDGGSLFWKGQPFVVADGADVERASEVRLMEGAIVCLRETVVLGRAGEKGGCLDMRTRVSIDERPAFIEDLSIAGARPEPGVLGTHRIIDSILLFGARLPDGPYTFQLEESGSIARLLGAALHRATLDASWHRIEAALREPALDHRPIERNLDHART